MSAYCTQSNAYDWIPPGTAQDVALLVSHVSTTSETLTVAGHGLSDDDPVQFRAESGGELPSGITEGTTYYAIVVTDSQFQISTTAGGSAVNLGGTATNLLMIAPHPWTRWIEEESATLECSCPEHVVPFTTVPAIVRKYVAAMVAKRACIRSGKSSVALDSELRDSIRPELALWRKGIPIRGETVPDASGLATYGGSTTETDPRCWTPTGGGLP